jgi:tetratricopeptide (TPR) repeat protein
MPFLALKKMCVNFGKPCLLGLCMLLSLISLPTQATAEVPSPVMQEITDHSALSQAIQAYRVGDYDQTLALLEGATVSPANNPATTWYYLALAHAQLQHVPQSMALYQRVVQQFPHSAEAHMAQQGLVALQAQAAQQAQLDWPPGVLAPGASGGTANVLAPNMSPNTPSAEQLQIQAMIGMLGGGNQNGGRNNTQSLLDMMMQTQNNAANGTTDSNPSYDPNTMSTLLMNEMMGQLDFERPRDRD